MKNPHYTFRDLLPLIILFLFIFFITVFVSWYQSLNYVGAMRIFMAAFFLIFGCFKVINLAGFAKAYAKYDIIAKRSMIYAYLYPFLELALGLAYFKNFSPLITNICTTVLMSISAVGVAHELAQKKEITCACLGMVFKVPMTYVTLIEDLLMVGMAVVMLLFFA